MKKSDEVVVTTRGALWRSRWAAVGAAMAVIAGVGGLGAAFASGEESSTVTISPCRLVDTRPGAGNLGPRNTPLGQGQTMTVSATGRSTNCNIPSSASAVILNVTSVGGTADSYLTVWPTGFARPTASNMNWRAGSGATANQVTTPVTSIGNFSVFNFAGAVDVVVDVVAYMVGTAPDRLTQRQVGSRSWYSDRGRPTDILVADNPVDTVYDGRYVWVSEINAGRVQRIDPRTNQIVSEDTSPGQPRGMAYGSDYVWVADASRNSVWRYPTPSGAPLEIAVGNGPSDVVFDGFYVWVSNFTSGTLTKIVASTGVVVGAVPLGLGSGPEGLAYDGTSVYVALFNSDQIAKVNPSTLAVTTIDVGDGPRDLEYDGQYLWSPGTLDGSLVRYNPATSALLLAGFAPGIVPSPDGVVFDGTDLWVGRTGTPSIVKVDRETLAVLDEVRLTFASTSLMWDGTNVWATLSAPDKLAKVRIP